MKGTGAGFDRAGRARDALRLIDEDAARAATLAADVLADAEATGDGLAAAIAGRVLGITRRDAGHLDEARRLLGRAIESATGAGAPTEAALARVSLVGVLLLAGDLAGARDAGRQAAPHLGEVDAAALAVQLAVVDERAGRFATALDAYARAEPVLSRHGEVTWRRRLLVNRGVVLAQLGRIADAELDTDLAEALGPGPGTGASAASAVIALNRAWFAALAADVPRALGRYDDALLAAQAAGWPVGLVLRDRADLLATVGLWAEAVAAATAAVADLDRASPTDAAEARLVLAAALAGAGRHDAAAASARAAATAFTEQGRPVWAARAAALAATLSLPAIRGGSPRADVVDATRAALGAAAELAAAGLRAEALEARAAAVRISLAGGLPPPDAAGALVPPFVPPFGPPWVRARAWLAEAEWRAARSDGAGSARAATAGLRALDVLRTTLGSVELRAGLAGVAAELADHLVASAVDAGNARRVLAAAERRVGRPVRPDAEARTALEPALVALRAAAGQVALAGDGEEAAVALRVLADAETAVRTAARTLGGEAGAPIRGPHDARRAGTDELAGRLGDGQVLARFVVDRGALLAVTVGARGIRRHDLGRLTAVVDGRDRLAAALRRQASRPGRAAAAVATAAIDLDDLLLRPLRRRLGDGRVVVVPDGPLHGVAWGALPALAGRPVSTAPSIAAWRAATDRPRLAQGRGVFAAGPGLDAVASEVAGAAAAWRSTGGHAEVLTEAAATVAAVSGALDGADLAHLACHGRLRSDAPPFSALELADGPLTGFDLELLPGAPSTVVLAACDLGASSAVAGAELLGFPAWLLGAGTRTVVASLVPVPDVAGAAAFGAVVAALAAGVSPAEAVLAAAAVDPTVGAGLLCIGAG